jgi:hypothetical protein
MKKNELIGVIIIMFIFFFFAKAEEVNFDGEKNIELKNIINMREVLNIQEPKIGDKIPDTQRSNSSKSIDYTLLDKIKFCEETIVLYNIDGKLGKRIPVKKIIEFKFYVTSQKYLLALDFFNNIYTCGSPIPKNDFEKIKSFFYLANDTSILKYSDEGEWELVSSEEVGEMVSVDLTGKQIICRIIKEIWCRLVCHGVPESDHPNCIQECITIHKKVCDDGSN